MVCSSQKAQITDAIKQKERGSEKRQLTYLIPNSLKVSVKSFNFVEHVVIYDVLSFQFGLK